MTGTDAARLAYTGTHAASASGEALVVLPEGYGTDPARRWPLLVFLHGAGERGDDPARVAVHGPPAERRAGRDLPFVIVAPQVPLRERWTVARIAAVLDAALAAYRVDPDCVYLTGLSMGGFGVWECIEAMPERIAAAVPICGGGNHLGLYAARTVPVWAFHGAQDDIIPLDCSERMVQALHDAGGDARLTVYPDAGHDSWTETYRNADVYAWLLQHRRAAPPDAKQLDSA